MKIYFRLFRYFICSAVLLLSLRIEAGELTVKILASKGQAANNTVVELIEMNHSRLPEIHVEILQENKEFLPELSIIPVGATVDFINQDSFKHHVYSVSKGNQFDLPLYEGKPAESIKFDTPGVVTLGCNIHDWMLAFAYIQQSDKIAISDERGEVVFDELPTGSYQLNIWNPRLRNNKKVIVSQIDIVENQKLEKEVNLRLRKKVRKPPRNSYGRDYDS